MFVKFRKFNWKELFFGRKLTKEDYFKHRLRMCFISGIMPKDVSNFWKGIEELKLKYCVDCGRKLSLRTRKIAKVIKPKYILCRKCNPHPIRPF